MPRKGDFINLTGQHIGKWTVLAPILGRGEVRFLCRCSCGAEREVVSFALRSGKSNGCKKCQKPSIVKHGLARDKNSSYGVWHEIKRRCYNKNSPSYKDYGGSGITVCDRWLSSAKNFVDDMGPRPSLRHSIDRINPFGNYEPLNCRWATDVEQANNRKVNWLRKMSAYGWR